MTGSCRTLSLFKSMAPSRGTKDAALFHYVVEGGIYIVFGGLGSYGVLRWWMDQKKPTVT